MHDDEHSSTSIKGERWKCWVCNVGGSILDWVAMYENVNILTAAKILGHRYGLNLSDEKPNKVQINKCRQNKSYVDHFEEEYTNKMMEYARAMRTMDRLKKEVRPITPPLHELRTFVDNNWDHMDNLFWDFSLHIDFKEKFKIFKVATSYLGKMQKLNLI